MKKYLIGFIIGAVLMSSTGVLAAVGDKIEATFSSYIFKVNGEEQTLDAEPLTYQGTTYLPVRTVANILGYSVTYDADRLTIGFNGTLPPAPVEPVIEEEPTETVTTPEAEPETSPEPSSQPSESGDSTTPSTEPAASAEASPEPSPSEEVTEEPAPTETVEVVDEAACQAINESYAMQIFTLQNTSGPGALTELHYVEYARDQELADAGC